MAPALPQDRRTTSPRPGVLQRTSLCTGPWRSRDHPPADPSQDEVWLLSGDQLFGRVLRTDGRSVVLDARFGRRTLPWTAVRGIYLRRQAAPARPETAGRVRLAIDNGADAEPDRLEGVVLALDEGRCRLRHPLFGELNLERGRVVRIQWP